LNQNLTGANAPSSKASYTAGDATAGVSFRMTSHLAAGVLFDYNHTDAKTDSIGSKTTVNSYSPGLFATYFDHGFYVNGLFSFGYNNYTNTRNISALGATASSHPTGQQYVGDLDFGYDFHPDKTWVIGPTIGATYTHLNIDSFTETGAPGADLAVNTQSQDSLRSRLGGHVLLQTNTGDVLLQPNITAMWQHEYMDSSSGITSSFADFSSSPFTIQTAAPSRDSALVGCGLTATLNNSMALYLNYLADIGAGDYFAQSVIGGFKARF
jgi:outer membrane autotransporter protein